MQQNINRNGTTDLVRSPINYSGRKYKLLPQLLPLFPKEIRFFCDLFVGSGDVIANIKGAHERKACDKDKNLVSIQQMFATIPPKVLFALIGREINHYGLDSGNKDGYLALRNDWNASTEKSPLHLYLLHCHAFNNMFRFNKRGEWNLPFGSRTFNDSMKGNVTSYCDSIQDCTFEACDFEEMNLNYYGGTDFVYADPPYLITSANYNENGGWKEEDDIRLFALLDRLDRQGTRFGLSNVFENRGKRNERLIEWSRKYNVHHLNHSYSNCSYHGKNREMKTDEVFIENYG